MATTSSTPTLLGLPAELRVEIFKLVVFHREAGGVISPGTKGDLCSFVTNVPSERFTVTNGQPRMKIRSTSEMDAEAEGKGGVTSSTNVGIISQRKNWPFLHHGLFASTSRYTREHQHPS